MAAGSGNFTHTNNYRRSAFRQSRNRKCSLNLYDKEREVDRRILSRPISGVSDYSEQESLLERPLSKITRPQTASQDDSLSNLKGFSLTPMVTQKPLMNRELCIRPKSFTSRASDNDYTIKEDSPLHVSQPNESKSANLHHFPSSSAFGKKSEFSSTLLDTKNSRSLSYSYDRLDRRLEIETALDALKSCDKKEEEKCQSVSRLREAIWEVDWTRREDLRELRTSVLKEMYKVMSMGEARLATTCIPIILKLRPSGKNLYTVFRVCYRISEDVCNDQLLMQPSFITLFLTITDEISATRKNIDILLYAYATLRNVTSGHIMAVEQTRVLEACLGRHLIILGKQFQRKADQDEKIILTYSLLIEVIQNLLSSTQAYLVSSDPTLMTSICNALALSIHNQPITFKLVHLITLMSCFQEFCLVLGTLHSCFNLLIQIIKKYFANHDLLVESCFVLGSLCATEKSLCLKLFHTPQTMDVLTALLHHYLTSQRNEIQRFHQIEKLNMVIEDQNKQIVLQVLRILANMSLSVEVARSLAKNSFYVDLICELMGSNTTPVDEGIGLCALVTLGNITSILGENLTPSTLLVTERLLEVYSKCDDPDFLSEISLALANLAQNDQSRTMILKRKIFGKLLNLIESPNSSTSCNSSGLILNLLTTGEGKRQFKTEFGTARVTLVLQDLVSDEYYLGSLLCQIIWNFLDYKRKGLLPDGLTEAESKSLVSALEHLIDERLTTEEVPEEVSQWENHFYPFAMQLLEVLKSGIAHG